MKRNIRRIAGALAALMILTQTAYAENMYMHMSGYTDKDALGVTVLVLDKAADLSNVQDSNIRYISQGKINSDGTYSVNLPINLDYNDLIVKSNMSGFFVDNSETVRNKTVYVSQNGNDANDGESADAPLKSLGAAYGKLSRVKKIVIMDDVEYSVPQIAYSGTLEIEGYSGNEKIIFPESVELNGDVSFDNLTIANQSVIYADGNQLIMGENVKSEQRLTVFGGGNGKDCNGDTSLLLLGGKYNDIYGGSSGASVNGNTNVVVGGNANAGDTINDDDTEHYSPCHIFGGSYQGSVTGKTNVTLDGSAVASYISGGGYGGETYVTDTNIYIKGGKVMNVYGGSVDGTLLENCNTHITMTGGLAEAIFGGSISNAMHGNTYINLIAGDVSRRVYTGCYNNWSLGWTESFYVTGTTNLTIHPDIKLNTKTELSSGNRMNMGVFAGSRQGKTQFENEVNTVIFADGCYDAQKGNMGDVSGWSSTFGSFPNYTVKATDGGDVNVTENAGTVSIAPEFGYYAMFGDNVYTQGTINLTKNAVDTIEFKKDFLINSVKTTDSDNGIIADVGYDAKNITNQTNPKVIVAVYDDHRILMTVSTKDTDSQKNNESFELNCDLQAGNTYTVKALIWNEQLVPLATEYKIQIKK